MAAQFSEQPANVAKLQALGMEPQGTCRDAFAAQMAREAKSYTQLARELKLKVE